MSSVSAFLVTVLINEENRMNLGRRYILSPEGTTLGNVTDADILLRLDTTSPCHLRLRKEEDSWYLSDLAEYSGAYINDLIVQNSQIFDGDILRVGSLGFEFCSGTGIKVSYFEQIENLLQEDFLTRAYNRGFLMNLLQLEVFRYNRWVTNARMGAGHPTPSPISLIFVDTDHFGQLNKKYGHPIGDEVLRELVRRITSRLRTTDIIARYGGEEFVVVLLDTPHEQAIGVAEDIRQLIESTPFMIDDYRSVPVTISGGVAELVPGMEVLSFIKAADDKMRLAKSQGRNKIVA